MSDRVSGPPPLLVLLNLARQARLAASWEELGFLAVNDTHALASYRQAALWFEGEGVKALSGVVQPESNAPYVHWLNRVGRRLREMHGDCGAIRVSAPELPPEEASEWSDWLPEFALWIALPAPEGKEGGEAGGLLFAGDTPWSDDQLAVLQEWAAIWLHAWQAKFSPLRWSWHQQKEKLLAWWRQHPERRWWQRPQARVLAGVLALLFFPVRLTVLAPGELVPANPAVIRAPLEGVVGQFYVTPNQSVKAGQPLFSFDEAQLATRRDVAVQSLATAEAEYRQLTQQALSDSKSKAQLASLLGRVEEKRVEAAYLSEQLERSHVVAPQDGIALFDDPSEWIGKPVQTGERIMRIAAPGDVEVEAWLALGDAIPLADAAPVSLYLAASPLSSLSGQIRFVAHDATARPNGVYAYRVRARLDDPTDQRVGLKGTAKLYGSWSPLCYWILRRPLATIRQTLGF